ncbi:uncharacterized protein LOC126824736 isoform X2 [Patella vulgata]|uniref:uncharacterized protein LOC126824736 isoform X2 n=1 Tax=Patella vulgata TaxID=6465 RepID=UPI0024A84017|nr:uncharacterized protein LOC126824736 isoform X2 [Patella vulgata]
MDIETSEDYKLSFQDINIFINKTQILHNVCGDVQGKEVLAVMGPSGSGKTTMLNAIAGREAVKSGEITINDQCINKQLRRKMGYVLQQDLFYSNLTLWETLYFTAMLHIPEKVPTSEKLRRIDAIIETLDLEKCRKTIIGAQFTHGLSGGEKKRLSIACELLTNPDIMLLDEPTSGLDSSTAYSLMVQVKRYAEMYNKAVIVTIHQPSSQIFHMFNTLLLLADGHVAYFGKAEKALDFFEEINFVCEPHFNPADFLLELVKKDEETLEIILENWKAKSSNKKKLSNSNSLDLDNFEPVHEPSDITLQYIKILDPDENKDIDKLSNGNHLSDVRWQSSFWTQLKMLTWRNFKESRSRILSKYVVGSNIVIAVAMAVLWFQMERSYKTIRDRMGWSFFIIVYWGFSPIMDAVISFPMEKTIMLKERAAGSYRLSAYYLAKTISEIPLIALLPFVFVTITYWAAGMKGVVEYIATMLLISISAINSQGFGFVLGAGILNFELALTSSTTFMLLSLTLGGFYIQRFPPWLVWSRYLSLLHYPFSAISILEFADTAQILCANVTVTQFPQCGKNGTDFVTSKMILEDFQVTLPIYCYVCTLIIMTILVRILGYFVLRLKTRQKHLS